MTKIYFYRKSIFLLLSLLLFGEERVHIWKFSRSLNCRKIKFPNASEYVGLMKESRRILAECFIEPEAYFLEIYFKKLYDLKFHDYYAFRKSIPAAVQESKIIVSGDSVMDAIFFKNHSSESPWFFGIFNFGGHLFWLLTYFLKFLFLSMVFGGKRFEKEVVYLRKKPYPDLGMMDQVRSALIAKSVEVTPLFSRFGKPDNQLQFYCLNELNGSIRRLLCCYVEIFKKLHLQALFFCRHRLTPQDIRDFSHDLVISIYISQLDSKILLGVLVDKPIFSLISSLKGDGKKSVALNESFFYPPLRAFDYVNADIYCSMNEIDSSMQNLHGGKIDEFFEVGFIRQNQPSTGEGLSHEFVQWKNHRVFVALFAPIQVSEIKNVFSQWGQSELENFVVQFFACCSSFPHIGFVFKEKKGELKLLDSQLVDKFSKYKNCFLIRSDVPRDLRYDQFEDVLGAVDLVVSMSHTSTTIWQAISIDIPFIAVNDAHSPSFLSEFQHFECRSDEISTKLNFWLSVGEQEKRDVISLVKQRVNINPKVDSFEIIAEKIRQIYVVG